MNNYFNKDWDMEQATKLPEDLDEIFLPDDDNWDSFFLAYTPDEFVEVLDKDPKLKEYLSNQETLNRFY